MKPTTFDYYVPTNVDEALTYLAELGNYGKVLAGGQSLIPAMNFRMSRPSALVDLNNIPELQYILPDGEGGLKIGTMTRDSVVEYDERVKKAFPLITEAMPYIAHAQIRNRGTFGGAIAHADPAGQLPAIVLTLNASMKINKKGQQRTVKADDFFFGAFSTALEPDEMLIEVLLPGLPEGSACSYQQLSRQRGGYAQAAAAVLVILGEDGLCKDVRLTLLSVADVPVLSKEAKKILVGQKPTQDAFNAVSEAASKSEIDPGSDVHATANYRRHLTKIMIVRSLNKAFSRAADARRQM
ncbi:MAG TPA: xanthine dehydrogenase family protein subunit M [Anaerolineaceae bacterium]|nr:xanthine dehydrogenase family protein subunit M [Anaerolineaceae bacterium]